MSGTEAPGSVLAGCAIVMAHPDDEMLFASSVLGRAAKVILAFGPQGNATVTEGRGRTEAEFPLNTAEFLNLTEAGAMNRAAWPNPERTEAGLAITRPGLGLSRPAEARYRANFDALCRMLPERLAGITDVVTHNPWGEYGHEDHVLVFRAVTEVQKTLGFKVWVTSYVAPKPMALMRAEWPNLGAPTADLPTDKALAKDLMQLYIRHNCWTWHYDYIWPETERFFPWLPGHGQPVSACIQPMNILPDVTVAPMAARIAGKVWRMLSARFK